MKKFYTLAAAILVTMATVFAQSPDKISYQAVVRNNNDALLVNAQVRIKLSILQGSIYGKSVYVETHSIMTNENGLVSIEIGGGRVVSGNFSTIDWSLGSFFIKTEIDPTGGTNYTIVGTSQLLSVPYALYAKTSGTSTPGPKGDKGDQGEQGVAGPKGDKGDKGDQGEQGVAGPKGDKGDKGDQGEQGVAGPKGDKGDKGDQGEQGIAGPKGDKGDKGEQGEQGVAGPKGDKGDQGEQGIAGPKGDKGDKGDQGEQGIAGPKGDKGDKGDQGEQGVAGPKGDKGDKGDQGEQGVAGPKGDKGDQGEQGVAGPKGDKGDKGDQGEQGVAGPKGDKGDKGDQGEQGIAGPKGDKGDKGDQGEQGIAGPKGDKGDKGDQGEQGVAGPKGDKGDKGDQGEQGIAGPKGDKGDKGDQGEQGIAGPKGDKGDKGDQGEQGIAGPKGDKGDKGDQGEQGIAGPKGDKGDKGDQGEQGVAGPKGDKGDQGDPGVAIDDTQVLTDKTWSSDKINTELSDKVTKVSGKGLSTEDYTTEEKNKLAAISGVNTGDQDISGIAINAAAILELQAEQIIQNAAIALNTAKVSNATHTGDVTGSDVLTIGDGKVTDAKIADMSATKLTGTVAIANGGTGASTKAAAFNALSPMTAAGDIIYGGTDGTGTALAKGTAGQVLTMNAGATAPEWKDPSVPTNTVVTKATNYTATSSDKYIICTAALTITLPTAIGKSGTEYIIKNISNALVTVVANGAEVIIQDSANQTNSVNLGIEAQNNWIKVVSDGANWICFRSLY